MHGSSTTGSLSRMGCAQQCGRDGRIGFALHVIGTQWAAVAAEVARDLVCTCAGRNRFTGGGGPAFPTLWVRHRNHHAPCRHRVRTRWLANGLVVDSTSSSAVCLYGRRAICAACLRSTRHMDSVRSTMSAASVLRFAKELDYAEASLIWNGCCARRFRSVSSCGGVGRVREPTPPSVSGRCTRLAGRGAGAATVTSVEGTVGVELLRARIWVTEIATFGAPRDRGTAGNALRQFLNSQRDLTGAVDSRYAAGSPTRVVSAFTCHGLLLRASSRESCLYLDERSWMSYATTERMRTRRGR